MGAQMVVEELAQVIELLVQMLEMLLQAGADQTVGAFQVEPIGFGLADGLDGFQAPHEGLELAQFPGRRRPGGRLLGGDKAGDHGGVGVVGLGARQFTARKGMDPGGVDDADAHAGLVQEQGEVIAVSAGFQSGLQRGGTVALAPVSELGKAGGCVVEGLGLGLACGGQQDSGEGALGDVDAEKRKTCHGGLLGGEMRAD